MARLLSRARQQAVSLRQVWRASRWATRSSFTFLQFAGPLALISVVLLWTALQAFGWALLYWPSEEPRRLRVLTRC